MAPSNEDKTSKEGRLTWSLANSPADIDGGAFIKFAKIKVVYVNHQNSPQMWVLIPPHFMGETTGVHNK